jgi:erythromycin esterase-like protein
MRRKQYPQNDQLVSSYREIVKDHTIRLDSPGDLDLLMDRIGDAKIVLLGEATHGTHEFYTWRAQISKRLIKEKNFSFIAAEGDWPDCYRLNRYVKRYPDSGKSSYEVLHEFNRWPTWMWANWEMVALSDWLLHHNYRLPADKKVGFYGLDVYSLWESLDAILKYLDKVDPVAKEKAMQAFRCFEPYSDQEGQSYARATMLVPASCEAEVIELLSEISRRMWQYNTDHEAAFNAEQNALVSVNAERYYRTMVKGTSESWNIRDHHMMDTLERLLTFHGPNARAIVWEHNTHIGDARYTDMKQDGMVNVGQLARQRFGEEDVVSVGFGTYEGTVIAGRSWGDVMRVMHVPPATRGSWEYLLHQSGAFDKYLIMNEPVKELLSDREFGHRAIGVVYHPEYEHLGNYVPSLIPYRYDAFVFLDKTKALHPLHMKSDVHQIPETFPFGV